MRSERTAAGCYAQWLYLILLFRLAQDPASMQYSAVQCDTISCFHLSFCRTAERNDVRYTNRDAPRLQTLAMPSHSRLSKSTAVKCSEQPPVLSTLDTPRYTRRCDHS